MRLRRLSAERFRNLEPFELRTDAQFVVLSGENAQGKTNALEAIHLLATLKPLRGRRTRDLVRWGQTECSVVGAVVSDGLERAYRVDLGPGGRTALLDGKRAADLQEYFGGIRAISFVPSDGEIVSGEPALRRRWLDRAAFTAAPAHLDVVRVYRRCLEQKGAALRQERPDRAVLDVLDAQLAQAGAELAHRRASVLRELAPHVQRMHAEIAGSTDAISLRYTTAAVGSTVAERAGALADRLRSVRSDEVRRHRTLAGPQTDDVKVKIAEKSARTFGSRGQVRSVVLALKLAELVAARERGAVPIFLVDDLSSELDRARTGRLLAVLQDLETQVFATTTDTSLMDGLPPARTLRIGVRAGVLDPTEQQ